MSAPLNERLNKILARVTAADFLSGSGIGNETAFYVFEYPAACELQVRDYLGTLLEHIPRQNPKISVRNINLFDLVVDHLRQRRLLDKAITMQQQKGDDALRKALDGPLDETRIGKLLANSSAGHNLVILSGVGSVWPLLRSHTLLSNLQADMGNTPLVMFYPGRYDGQSLKLFGKLRNENYYRAFKLIP